jgi:hypothetical protein
MCGAHATAVIAAGTHAAATVEPTAATHAPAAAATTSGKGVVRDEAGCDKNERCDSSENVS